MYFKSALALTAATAASAQHIIPVSQVNTATSLKNIYDKGLARLQAINGETTNGGVSSGKVTNEDVSYVAPVSIGGKTWHLIVDTGSSNLWCGARKACEPSSSGKATGGRVEVSYGSGEFEGKEYFDTASFGGLTVKKQSLGAASSSTGFQGVDGILGLGPVDLTQDTVSNADTVPTFMDNLYKQGSISTEVLGVYFTAESGSDSNDKNGELTLGGTDSSKYTGSIKYFPRLASGGASPYWGIAVSGFSYGSKTVGGSGSGIVDTGTTLIYVPSAAYKGFLSAAGGKTDATTGLASFSKKPTQNFSIHIGGSSFTLTPAQYLVPQAQYQNFGLTSGKYYSWIGNGGSGATSLIIGQKFIENYYSVFDTSNNRIGFAAH